MSVAHKLSATYPAVSYEGEDETWTPQADCHRVQLALKTEKPMHGEVVVSAVVYGPPFAREIGLRLTEGLHNGLPVAISVRLREARALAIANRRKWPVSKVRVKTGHFDQIL